MRKFLVILQICFVFLNKKSKMALHLPFMQIFNYFITTENKLKKKQGI